jgi:hypothetical protein
MHEVILNAKGAKKKSNVGIYHAMIRGIDRQSILQMMKTIKNS